MQRNIRMLALIAAAALLLSAGSAFAVDRRTGKEQIDRQTDETLGGVHKLDRARPMAEQPVVPLPMPIEPEALSYSSGVTVEDSGLAIGGAILTPRGGAVSTPKQQADREIRKLIGRLG